MKISLFSIKAKLDIALKISTDLFFSTTLPTLHLKKFYILYAR